MKYGLRAQNILEQIGFWFNLGPFPVAETFFGMTTARVMMAATSLGLFAELAAAPRRSDELASSLKLEPEGVRHLLGCLCALGHVVHRAGRFSLSRRARMWLDPASPRYMGDYFAFNYDQWEWWSRLEHVLQTGEKRGMYAYPPGDSRWRNYVRATYQLARVNAPEVAAKLRLPGKPRRLLDIGGGHGWYSAQLCLRHPGLQATVLDLGDGCVWGREIVVEAGMEQSVSHVDGDFLTSDLGGPYDCVLAFQIIHPLTVEQNMNLLNRVYAALAPGGTLAVLDYFDKGGHTRDFKSLLHLHFHITSGATYTEKDLLSWLREAGFEQVRKARLLRQPVQTLMIARKGKGPGRRDAGSRA